MMKCTNEERIWYIYLFEPNPLSQEGGCNIIVLPKNVVHVPFIYLFIINHHEDVGKYKF